MEETYKLNALDVLHVLEQQLATSDFDGQTDYIPYQEFNGKGDCAYEPPQALYGEIQGHKMSWWPFSLCDLWTWTIHSWLPWTSLACRDCVWLVSKVGPFPTRYHCSCTNLHIYRCDAMPEKLDGPGSHHRSHEKTDFLIKKFDPSILWDEFGIKSDIVVCMLSCLSCFIHLILVCTSHLLTDFHTPISMSSSHLTFCTNSSKVHSRIIWWCGWVITCIRCMVKRLHWISLRILTISNLSPSGTHLHGFDKKLSISAVLPYMGLHWFSDGWDYNPVLNSPPGIPSGIQRTARFPLQSR